MSAPEDMPPLPSNPADDDSGRILAATVTVTVAAFITYLARMYTRLVMVRNAGLDDFFMTLAMALSISGEGIIGGSVMNGAGRHLGDIPLHQVQMGLKLNFISQTIYLAAICVVKLGVGQMLLRIASVPIYKRIIVSLMVFMALWTTMCIITLFVQCTDIRALWDPTIPPSCWSTDTLHGLSYSNLAVSLLTDLAFALFIPVPMLWKLNINRRTRISLVVALSLGTLACVAAFVKIPSIVNFGKNGDFLWDSRDITIWTIVECNVGIFAANMASLRPLFKSLLGNTILSGGRSAKPSGGSNYWRQKTGGSNPSHSVVASRKDKPMVIDEASSDRAFNNTSYELGYTKYDESLASSVRPTYGSNAEVRSSEESVLGVAAAGGDGRGITRTTRMTVEYGVASST